MKQNLYLTLNHDPKEENGKLKTVKMLYTDLLSKSEMLDNDRTHKLVMRAKRKYDDEDDSLIRAIKKRKVEIGAVFSFPEDSSEVSSEGGNSSDQYEDDAESINEEERKDPNILWHTILEESTSALHPDKTSETLNTQSDKKIKKSILKDVISRYMNLVEQSEMMKTDPVHKAIQRTMSDLLSQHKYEYHKAKYDKDEALQEALRERTPLIKKAIMDDDEDDIISLSSISDDESTSALGDGQLDWQEELKDEQWLIDIFNESVMEKYDIDDEEDVDEQAKAVLNDENSLEQILPIIRKKYLQLVLLIEQLRKSEPEEPQKSERS